MASSTSYPEIVPGGGLLLSYQLKNKRVLIVGGGPVAAGRLVNVKDADAHVTVIAPRSGLCREMKYRIEEEHTVDVYHDRNFVSVQEELDEPQHDSDRPTSNNHRAPAVKYDLVLTAIDNGHLSREICRACRVRRIPVNVADVPPECDFYFGSLIRRGPLQVMVSTGGKGPKLAALIRQRVELALPQAVGPAIEKTGRLRSALRHISPHPQDGKKRMGWMSSVCLAWSFEELAQLDDQQIEVLLQGYQATPQTVPSKLRVIESLHPIHAPSWHERVGHSLSSWTARTSDTFATPWVAGLTGALAGTALTTAIFFARESQRA